MAKIMDSGDRTEFESGAVRDLREGKGRCDLLPLSEVGTVMQDEVFYYIHDYVYHGNKMAIVKAIKDVATVHFDGMADAMLEVSKHYEDGCNKYGERNWEKGIPVHCYIDSGIRHYLKMIRGDQDERHDRAFIWNMLGALWTHNNKPELIDLPFAKGNKDNE